MLSSSGVVAYVNLQKRALPTWTKSATEKSTSIGEDLGDQELSSMETIAALGKAIAQGGEQQKQERRRSSMPPSLALSSMGKSLTVRASAATAHNRVCPHAMRLLRRRPLVAVLEKSPRPTRAARARSGLLH